MIASPADRLGPPIDARPLLLPDRWALVSLLRDLGRADWRRPTVCPGWSVKDVAAHVLGDDLGRLARTRDGYRGLGARPGEPLAAFVDRINDEWVVAARRLSPDVVVDLLATTGEQINELWQGMAPDALGEPVSWAGPEPAPVWLDAARDFTEYWVHQQQIRDATEHPGQQHPDTVHVVLDTFLRALPHTLRDATASSGAQVQVTVTGAAGGDWTATQDTGGWSLRRGAGDSPAARVTLDPDTAWRLCTAGISPDWARDLAVLEGERRLCEAVLRIVSIIR